MTLSRSASTHGRSTRKVVFPHQITRNKTSPDAQGQDSLAANYDKSRSNTHTDVKYTVAAIADNLSGLNRGSAVGRRSLFVVVSPTIDCPVIDAPPLVTRHQAIATA